ncbi:MAG: hypothetical protein GX488_04680 [Clostridiales bacterium]|nr:hypothetical protein [Clostridiales bacterium]
MGYTAQWGNKGFLISPSKIVPISNISTSLKLKSNSENDTSGTPTINTRGRELQTISFDTQYLAAAGVDPRGQIAEWEAELGNAYPLYIGGKRFGPPKMMLKSVDISDMQLTPNGAMISVSIAITLEEYDESNTSALASDKNASDSKAQAMSATASSSDRASKKTTK